MAQSEALTEPPNKEIHKSGRFLSYLGCLSAILLWSGWIVLSRHGAQTTLSAVDLSFIRFTTALVCSVPLWFFYDWRRIPVYRLLLACWTSGVIYTTFCFAGLATAKAATSGVLINGLLPVFGAMIGYFWNGARISRVTAFCIFSILVADMLLIGGDWQKLGNSQGIFALLLLGGASLSFSYYTVAVKKWNLMLMDIVVWIPIVNFLSILPFWLGMETGIHSASVRELVIQALFQGVVITLGAGFLIAFTIKSLGPTTTTMFMATVPGVTAVLGFVALAEPLSMIEIISIFICVCALLLNAKSGVLQRRKSTLHTDSAP